jgi:hypothetical protein
MGMSIESPLLEVFFVETEEVPDLVEERDPQLVDELLVRARVALEVPAIEHDRPR